MQSRLAAISMMLLLAAAPAGFASGKKEIKATISFHLETEGTDNPKMIFQQLANGKQRFFLRSPEVSTKDIISFSPFPSDVGDYGVVFRLKENAATRFAAISNTYQGRWLVSQVNGRLVDGVMLDQEVKDGKIVIWKGVTLADIALLDEGFPRIGEEGKKKK